MLDLTKVTEWKTYCGLPVDRAGEVVVMCKNESIGQATLEFDDETVEIEVCQEHYDKLDRAGASVLD